MKKLICVFVILILTLSLCSCGKEGGFIKLGNDNDDTATSVQEVGIDTLKLAYSRTDSLNPFLAESEMNIQLMALLYDGLYSLNGEYEPSPCIAADCIAEKTSLNITVSPSAVFSDGTAVTAADIVYSFTLAKASPAYGARLANFESARVSTANMLIITLSSPDPYASACLDFPIIKNLAEGDFPIGTGRYTAKLTHDAIYLVVNTARAGFNPKVKTIKLVPLKESSALTGSLEIGNTTFSYNDLASGTYSRINAKTVETGINNLVYLGFNSQSDIFGDIAVRKAVNLLIDRTEIVQTAFQGHARLAYTPFNPDWYALKTKDLVISRNESEAKALLESSGLDIDARVVILLVNSDNPFKLEAAQFISDRLEAAGFDIAIKRLPFESYTDAVKSLEYDFYIGETKLSRNMDLSAFLSGGSLSKGIDTECPSSVRYAQLKSGGCELMDFLNTYNEDLPFIALCYRNAAVSYTNSLSADFAACDCDIFCDIESWYFKSQVIS